MRSRMVLCLLAGSCTIEMDADPAKLAAYCADHIGEYPCPPLPEEQQPASNTGVASTGHSVPEDRDSATESTAGSGYFFAEVRWDIVGSGDERLALTIETDSPGCRLNLYQDKTELQVDGETSGAGVGTLVSSPDDLVSGVVYGADATDASVRSLKDIRMNSGPFVPEEGSTENEYLIEALGTDFAFVVGTFHFRRLCATGVEETPCLGELEGQFFCRPSVTVVDDDPPTEKGPK